MVVEAPDLGEKPSDAVLREGGLEQGLLGGGENRHRHAPGVERLQRGEGAAEECAGGVLGERLDEVVGQAVPVLLLELEAQRLRDSATARPLTFQIALRGSA